jgi:hypothetical protein
MRKSLVYDPDEWSPMTLLIQTAERSSLMPRRRTGTIRRPRTSA